MTVILKLNNRGLTLIEVLIALAIFTTSFFVLIDAQNLGIRNSGLGKNMTIASLLAEEKMAEMVLQYEGKPLREILPREEGEFGESFSKFRWEKTSRDFKYDLSFLIDMAAGDAPQEEGGSQSPLLPFLPKISDFISNSAKEITVTVFWKDGAFERKVEVTTHLFDHKAQLPL